VSERCRKCERPAPSLGTDLHKRQAQVAVLDDEGKVVEEVRVVADGTIYVGSYDGYVYALKEE